MREETRGSLRRRTSANKIQHDDKDVAAKAHLEGREHLSLLFSVDGIVEILHRDEHRLLLTENQPALSKTGMIDVLVDSWRSFASGRTDRRSTSSFRCIALSQI